MLQFALFFDIRQAFSPYITILKQKVGGTDSSSKGSESVPPKKDDMKTYLLNLRGGPLAGSMPKANTAGIMANAASIAARVSKRAFFYKISKCPYFCHCFLYFISINSN